MMPYWYRFNSGDESAFTELSELLSPHSCPGQPDALAQSADAEELARHAFYPRSSGLAKFPGAMPRSPPGGTASVSIFARNRYLVFRRRRPGTISIDQAVGKEAPCRSRAPCLTARVIAGRIHDDGFTR